MEPEQANELGPNVIYRYIAIKREKREEEERGRVSK